MSITEAFCLLNISQTKEEGAIRSAYHSLLKGVNPEDDPEGFKRLREAYEEAIIYARTPQEEEGIADVEWLQNQAVGAFMQKLADIYTILPRRIDLSEWESLLSDPVLESFEDAETAKWGLFSYLAEHFRLPDKIWRRLDKEFFIQENQKEFREHVPPAFVDYLLDKLSENQIYPEFPYDTFVGAPDADYDRFIRDYTSFMNQNFERSEESLPEKKRLLDLLYEQKIYHPWCELQNVLYLRDSGEVERSNVLFERLFMENPKDEHIRLVGAELLEEDGKDKEAYRIYQDYLTWENKTKQGQFRSFFGMAKIEGNKGDWVEAKRYADEAYRIGNSEALKEFLQTVYQKIVDEYLSREDDLEEDEVILLGFCFLHLGQWKEGLAFYERHPEHQKDTYNCREQLSNFYMYAGQWERVQNETERWRKCLTEEFADSEEDQSYLTYKTAQSYYVEGCALGEAYRHRREEGNTEEWVLQDLADQARAAFEHALNVDPENRNILIAKTLLLRDLKDYKGIVDVCDQALSYDPNNFQACYFLQEAYENLHMAQEVVDTFYRAKKIYDGNPVIYLRAVKVFMAYRQYSDALGIIEQAEAADAMDHTLLAKKACIICQKVEEKDKKGFQEAKKYASKITKQLKEENADPELLSELYLERAYLYETADQMHAKGRAKIISYLKKSLKYKDTNDARYFLGRFLQGYEKKPEEAYEQLKICEERHMDFKWLYFYIAQCHEDLGQEDEAIEYYEKLLEKDPEFNDAYWRIGWIYRKKLRRTMVKEYGEKALYYLNMQEEKFGAGYNFYRCRSYVWLCLNDPQKALEDIEKGMEKKKDSGMWLLKGRALKNLGRYEEAIECFDQSIHCEERYGQDDDFCYGRIFHCYLLKYDLKQAASYYESELKKVENEEAKNTCLETLVQCAAVSGDYEQAFRWLTEQYGTISLAEKEEDTWKKVADRIEDVLDIWLIYRDSLDQTFYESFEKAKQLALQAWQDSDSPVEDRAIVCHNVGEICFYQGKWREALGFLDKAYRLVKKSSEYKHFRSLYNDLMMTYYWLGDLEKAREYGDLYKQKLEEDYKGCEALGKSIEELMSMPAPDARQNHYHLFCYTYFTGQHERARGYIEMMCSRDMCYWCNEEDCTELWEAKGLMALYDQKEAEAVEAFQNSNRFCWIKGTRMAHMMLRVIKEQTKE